MAKEIVARGVTGLSTPVPHRPSWGLRSKIKEGLSSVVGRSVVLWVGDGDLLFLLTHLIEDRSWVKRLRVLVDTAEALYASLDDASTAPVERTLLQHHMSDRVRKAVMEAEGQDA